MVGNDCNTPKSLTAQQALADALVKNLNIRILSDIKCQYNLIKIDDDELCWQDKLRSCVISIEGKAFFIALGSCWTKLNLVNVIMELLSLKKPDFCYGIHFQCLSSMQAYFMKIQLKDANTSLCSTVVTALIQDGKSNPICSFPVLLYMIHLAIGENGERTSGRGHIPG